MQRIIDKAAQRQERLARVARKQRVNELNARECQAEQHVAERNARQHVNRALSDLLKTK